MKIRKLMACMLAAVCAAGFTACSSNTSSADSSVVSESSDNGGSASSDSTAAEMVKNAPATGGNIGDVTIQSGDIVAEFEIDGFGTIKAKLFPDIAPVGVQNFIQLAQDGYYTGKNIHRVISDFMLQGGSENGDGTGGPGYAIRGEFSSNGVENDLSHVRGVLSMARAQPMDSAGSQFFIMHKDSPHLDGQYAAFGQVTGNVEEAIRISEVPTDWNDKPKTPVVIQSIRVDTQGVDYPEPEKR